VYEKEELDPESMAHLKKWLGLGDRAKKIVENMSSTQHFSFEEKLRHTEQISIVFSMQNLLTYPMVTKKVKDGTFIYTRMVL